MKFRAACLLLTIIDGISRAAFRIWMRTNDIVEALHEYVDSERETLPPPPPTPAPPAVTKFRARSMPNGVVKIEPEDDRQNCWSKSRWVA